MCPSGSGFVVRRRRGPGSTGIALPSDTSSTASRSRLRHRRHRVANAHMVPVEGDGRIGVPGFGKVAARDASASPYTGYIEWRASFAGASRVGTHRTAPTEMGSAPLKMSRTGDRSSPSMDRSPRTFR